MAESAWVWKTQFEIAASGDPHVDLVFHGLDTLCHVYLDGQKLLYTDNMFKGDV